MWYWYFGTKHIFWDCSFKQDNVPCRKAQSISDWFFGQWGHCIQMAPTVTRSLFNRAPHGWYGRFTEKLQQLCDGVMSIKARIVEGPRMLYLEHSSCNKLKIISLLSIAIYSLPFTFRILLGYEIILSNWKEGIMSFILICSLTCIVNASITKFHSKLSKADVLSFHQHL